VPVVFFFGGSSAGRVFLQTLISIGSWIALAVQLGRVLRTPTIRLVSLVFVLLLSLSPPIFQWNRIVISESITISMTVLLLASALALARRMDARALACFLVVATLWTFSRQVQAFVVGTLVIPFLLVAWRQSRVRRVALAGGIGIAVIAVWGTWAALQTSQISPAGLTATNPSEVQFAGIMQYRAGADPAELSYFRDHGLPPTPALQQPPPFTRVGQPVNVFQFADPFAEYRLADDPRFKQWAQDDGEHVYLKYLITHPSTTLLQPIVHATQLMTMNPDYLSTPGFPSWLSTIVYGNLRSIAAPNAPAGAPRSSDPFYVGLLFGVGTLLFCLAAVRHRLTPAIWVAVVALLFVAAWAIAIWSTAATDLPRVFIETAVLFHVSIIVLVATTLDSLISDASRSVNFDEATPVESASASDSWHVVA
jgi:4-amino-4-deoxy-L-arabinose transferase-like glycosyltransferase